MVCVATLISSVALLSGLVFASPNGNVHAERLVRRSQPTRSVGSGTSTHSSAKQTVTSGSTTSIYRSSGTSTMSPPMYTPPAKNGAMPMYGSGSAPWMGSNYDDCVNQCVAQYGSSPSPYVPTPTMNSPSSTGPTGTGAVHTVIVAPSQGVFRFVPFAVNASVGDTIKFMWGANTHTVTKSSSLSPCNNTLDAPFASGTHDKGFVYTQVVNDTNPTFFHCAVPTHCSKGMFGIINPPNAYGSNTTVNGMMGSMMASNPSISAYSSMISNMTNTKASQSVMASNWGGSINMASLPSWSYSMVAENVLYTRHFLLVNPDAMNSNGTVDLSVSSHTPLMIPTDVGAAIQQANAVVPSTSSSSSAVAAATTTSSTAASTTSGAPSASSTTKASSTPSASSSTYGSGTTTASNGAIGISSPQIVVSLLSVVAVFLLV